MTSKSSPFGIVLICRGDLRQTQQAISAIKLNAVDTYNNIILIPSKHNQFKIKKLASVNRYKFIEYSFSFKKPFSICDLLNLALHYVFVGSYTPMSGCVFLTDEYIVTSYKMGHIWAKTIKTHNIINYLDPYYVPEYAKFTDSITFFVSFLTSPVLCLSKQAFDTLGYFSTDFNDIYTTFTEYTIRGVMKGIGGSIGRFSSLKGYIRYCGDDQNKNIPKSLPYIKRHYTNTVEIISEKLAF